MKILTWIMVNGASLVGVLQALVKAIKELVTGIVNLLSLFLTQEQAETSVKSVRNALNKVDGWLETLKGILIKL